MDITLSKEITNHLGKKLELFGLTEDRQHWKNQTYEPFEIDLSALTKTRARQLKELLESAGKIKGATARVADIDRWLAILEGEKVRCRKLADFAPMLKQYLKDAPRHWIYELRKDSEVYQPYYVAFIKYNPPESGRYYVPGYVTMFLYWEELGKVEVYKEIFYAKDCVDLTVGAALAQRGYTLEAPDILKSYQDNKRRYHELSKQIGLQCTATGVAEKEFDDDEDRWYRRKTQIILDKEGIPSRVVIDVINEGDTKQSTGEKPPDSSFWTRDGCDFEGKEDDDDEDIEPGDEDDTDPAEKEIPVLPLCPAVMCFDLKRHCRLKLYIEQLTKYTYQKDLADKLVLPDEITSLVEMLVAHKGGFKDIIGTKGGGAVILCAGPPGTGKTLTAEIYSEAMSRPLYSVQCSQLGTDPDGLEKELMIVFARSQRWNSILLLDEADVYVAARGHDLTQNAIVGVFLRVLEYYNGVLFMTTNRADLVDDAVASRCLARITYQIPTKENQARIWSTLAETAGIKLVKAEIDKVVAQFPKLSGRDVKNLLKLGSMVSAANGEALTANTIAFVKRFKPTDDLEE